MKIAIITGAGGLIGSTVATFLSDKFDGIVGVDNNMRKYFFGEEASIEPSRKILEQTISNFYDWDIDIRNYNELEKLFLEYGNDIELIVHTAAQPSHDWAAKEPLTDFNVNCTGTINLLELMRLYCPDSVFVYTSTNKVYGDNPNYLPFIETDTRYELPNEHEYFNGIGESFSIDSTKHSLFGCSKLAGDIYVQEYGKYFGLKTTTLRGGCLTGAAHRGVELHGFLNYLVKCIIGGKTYNIFGYKGKQVRDNIHAIDVSSAIYEIYKSPNCGEVYNIGGTRYSNCSITEAIEIIENKTNVKAKTVYNPLNRSGDHIWWISNMSKFKQDYPNWKHTFTIEDIIQDIIDNSY